jgi:hypothetical protein
MNIEKQKSEYRRQKKRKPVDVALRLVILTPDPSFYESF